MSIDDSFTKSYHDPGFQHVTTVRHKGTVVAFAMAARPAATGTTPTSGATAGVSGLPDDARRIHYTVLDLANEKADPIDARNWLANPVELRFPSEIAEVGYAIAGPTAMPVVTHGGGEVAADTPIQEEEKDLFKSTTARLTESAPFQVLSDERYVYVFRQAIGKDHPDMLFRTKDGCSARAAAHYVPADGERVPIVADTLLLDRFVLVGTALQPKLEVRFRRSRHKTRPQSNKDSLGARDMDGRLFLEPTQELSFVRNLERGRFTVLLLPTQVAAIQRWQIFACNAKTGMIDSWNIERSTDGLFNTRGTRLYTSPDPEHAKDVLERQPGTCPFTKKPLVPIARDRGYAEWALRFDGRGAHVKVKEGPSVTPASDLTLEAWIKMPCHGPILSIGPLRLDQAGVLRFGVPGDDGASPFRADAARSDHDWHHVAFVLRQEEPTDATEDKQAVGQFYLDGEELPTLGTAPNLVDGPLAIGCGLDASGTASGFTGVIDEVRIWTRARGQKEIKDDRHFRLVGDEPGLAGYWHFDEGSGEDVHDQTDHARHGQLGGGAHWVPSHAPLGDQPGIRRTSFRFEGRTIESQPSALLYHQNESAPAGNGAGQAPLKRHARVMLTVATKPEGLPFPMGASDPLGGLGPFLGGRLVRSASLYETMRTSSTRSADTRPSRSRVDQDRKRIAALDLGVSREGKLAQIPDNLALEVASAQGAESNSINQQLDQVRQWQQKIDELRKGNAQLEKDLNALEPALDALKKLETNDATSDWPELPDSDGLSAKLGPLIKELDEYQNNSIPMAKTELETLQEIRRNAEVWIHNRETGKRSRIRFKDEAPKSHGRYNFRDHNLNYSTALYSYEYLHKDEQNNRSWNDKIDVIDIKGPIRLLPYKNVWYKKFRDPVRDWLSEGRHRFNNNDQLSAIEFKIDDGHIKKLELFEKLVERARELRNRLKTCIGIWSNQRNRWFEQNSKNKIKLGNLEKQLQEIELKLEHGAREPMSLIHVDRDGLTISGAILHFAWTKDSPRLLDSATGELALYFRGEKDQFFAAYYDTNTARAAFPLPASGGGDVMLVARAAGSHLDEIAITVAKPHELTIQNPGAEGEDLSGWIAAPPDAWSACQKVYEPAKMDDDEHEPLVLMERAHGGDHFFHRTGSGEGTLSRAIDLPDGTDPNSKPTFRLAAWIGSARADETGRLEVDWLDGKGDTLVQTDTSGEQGPVFPLGTWQRVTLSGLVPQGAKRAKLRLCGSCCFDDLAFEFAVGAEDVAVTEDGADSRTLVLDNGKTKVREIWHRMPPAPEAFAAVLNGAAGEPELIGFLDAMKSIEANLAPPTDAADPAEAASPAPGLAEEASSTLKFEPAAVTTTAPESEHAFEVVLTDPLPRQVPEGARLIVVDRTLTAVADDDRSAGTIQKLFARLKQELPAGAALILLDDEPVAKQGELRITITEQPKRPPLEPGSHLQLFEKASGTLVDLGKLASVTVLPSQAAELTLEAPLPQDVPARAQIVVVAAEAKASEAAHPGKRRIWINREPPPTARTLILVDWDETQHPAPIAGRAQHLGPIIGKASGPLRCLVLKDPPKQKSFPAGASLRVGRALTPVTLKDTGQVLAGKKVHIEETDFGELEDGTAVYLVSYDYRSHAEVRSDELTWCPKHGSLLVTATAAAAKGEVKTGRISSAGTTPDCAWVAAAPGLAIHFNGKLVLGQADPEKLAGFDAQGDLTLEAWIKPGATRKAPIMRTPPVVHHHSGASRYALRLASGVEKEVAFRFSGEMTNYVEVSQLTAPKRGTIEAWIYASSQPKGWAEIVHIGDMAPSFHIRDGKLGLSIGDNVVVMADAGLPLTEWVHVAAVWDNLESKLYVKGNLVGQGNGEETTGTHMKIGRIEHNAFESRIDEVRVWSTVRTMEQIRTNMKRRVDGGEADLLGCWRFDGDTPRDYSGNDNHGSIKGTVEKVYGPDSLSKFRLVAEVSSSASRTKEFIDSDRWSHVAAVYHQSYGLDFDGEKDWLDCGNDVTLDMGRDLTLEVYVTVEDLGTAQGLLTRGRLNGGPSGQHTPYALYLDAEGRIGFAFADKDGHQHVHHSNSAKVAADQFCKIAVTRKHQTETKKVGSEYKVEPCYDINFSVSTRSGAGWSTPTGGYSRYAEADPGSSSEPLEIGRAYGTLVGNGVAGVQESHFEGVISEVRIWNVALPPQEVGARIHGHEKGLVAWWRLEENDGHVAYDTKGQSHATIKGAEWVKNPDPDASTLEIYLDGERVETEPADPPSLENTEDGFFLGRGFHGVLEEVRVWRRARTHEQILDNLFTRLKGEKEDLIAYYTFDDQDHEGGRLTDHALRGNHLPFGNSGPEFDVSDAPISKDIWLVRSALAGIKTDFHGTIGSPASAEEYGDLQRDSKGNLTGSLKRCYSFIEDGAWHLVTGYKVGNLRTEWVAQVQAAPQIIGYIEGAPPVPSENLTGSSMKLGEVEDYGGTSAIELLEADDLTYIYASSEDKGTDTALETTLAAGVKTESSAGIGVETQLYEANIMAGAKSTVDSSSGQLSEASVSHGRNAGRISRLELQGGWQDDDPAGYLNAAVGRRFIAANIGMAVVLSDTMDVFALRLAHNDAFVAYRMLPNPDIPKDWNLLTFPINPRYTKQGTLDGKVGCTEDGAMQCDPDYPNASTYGEWSYFKPREAYALKRRIERDRQELETHHADYETASAGEGAGAAARRAQLPTALAARNLANTYVWRADGGFYAESTEVMESVTESLSGSYSFSVMAGATWEFNTAITGAAISSAGDALMGMHVETTKTKGKEQEKSFSLEIEVDGERDIQLYVNTDQEKVKYKEVNEGGGAYDDGQPVLRPGKVDAYRFMTFYLEPSAGNFEDFFGKVVDPIWLNQSDAPHAVALRQAQQGDKKPKCWRVMHRVTFVSRVLSSEGKGAPALQRKAKEEYDISSNYELIRRLEPYVRGNTRTAADFAKAVRQALHRHLPELKLERKDEDEVVALMSDYCGVERET